MLPAGLFPAPRPHTPTRVTRRGQCGIKDISNNAAGHIGKKHNKCINNIVNNNINNAIGMIPVNDNNVIKDVINKINKRIINTIVNDIINTVDDDKAKADKKEKTERGEMK